MAKTKNLDMEASRGERPQRPDVLPAEAPNSAVYPDTPATPGDKQALEKERRQDEARLPPGGLPDGIPHGDKNPGAKPHDPKKSRFAK